MRILTYLLLTLTLVLSSCGNKQNKKQDEAVTETLEEKAQRIHDNVITIDTHVDFDVRNFTEEVNYTQELPIQVDLPKMEAGGLDAVFLIVYTGQSEERRVGKECRYRWWT